MNKWKAWRQAGKKQQWILVIQWGIMALCKLNLMRLVTNFYISAVWF
jgi:hypothetical protein